MGCFRKGWGVEVGFFLLVRDGVGVEGFVILIGVGVSGISLGVRVKKGGV